jgi:hypothetical protein
MLIDNIFYKLYDYFDVSSDVELAKKLNVSQPAISKWRTRNSVNAIQKKCRQLGIYNNIFGEIEQVEDHHEELNALDRIDTYVADLRLMLGDNALEVELKKLYINNILKKFHQQETALQQIMHISWEYDRPYLFTYYIFMIIQAKFEDNLVQNIIDYKEFLKDVISSYTVWSFKNKPGFSKKRKKESIEAIELLLTEAECKIMITNYKITLTALESSMSIEMIKIHKNVFKNNMSFFKFW